MVKLDKLKGMLEEKEAAPKEEKLQALPETSSEEVSLEGKEEIDRTTLNKIVERMHDKYVEEGLLKEETAGSERGEQLRAMIEAGPAGAKIRAGGPKELVLFESPLVRTFGKFYLYLEAPINLLSRFMHKSFGSKLERDLAAAGMIYTVEQYMTLALSATIVGWLISLLFLFLLVVAGLEIGIAVLFAIAIPIVFLGISLVIPGSRAASIGSQIDRELPFALRHMSIEVRAGVGIYKSMESVATSGYGPLSDGFRRVLSNIEKGVPAEEALESWAEHTRSEGLRRMVSHLVRALRTGGSLSDIMVTIAEDVAFERRAKIADFAEKLNLMSLFLMMVAIVMPVMVTILTAIGASPSLKQYLSMLSIFSPAFLALLYFVICPMLLLVFTFYIRSADPGV
jgi:flagellar protein FlaJ